MFTAREIQNLSEYAALPGLSDKNVLFPLLSKRDRQDIIRNSIDEEERRIAAVIQIQCVWRGCRTRSLLFSILKPLSSGSTSRSSNLSSRSALSRMKMRASLNPSRLSNAGCHVSKSTLRIESSYQKYTDEVAPTMSKNTLMTFQGFCAYTLQTWWRGISDRIGKNFRIKKSKRSFTPNEAVLAIQRAWRSHIDSQVFNYYKDLIRFRCQGDAKFMLKCINPKECDILDSASGIHVRFRLGGVKFPPTVYYKVFSHINVADVCSFAPRDYTKQKVIPSKFAQHRGAEEYISVHNDLEGWYRRIENNGWRPVADRVVKSLNQDSISYESSRKVIEYSHDKLQRRQDVERRKKKKKIQWLQKMYNTGILETKAERENEVKELVDTAAQSVFKSVDDHGIEAVDDWEVDELLEWTNTLNFDSYLQDWYEYGTTEIRKQDIEELKMSNT